MLGIAVLDLRALSGAVPDGSNASDQVWRLPEVNVISKEPSLRYVEFPERHVDFDRLLGIPKVCACEHEIAGKGSGDRCKQRRLASRVLAYRDDGAATEVGGELVERAKVAN